MFGDDLFSSFLPGNFFSNSIMSDNHFSRALMAHERAIRHVHQEFQRVAQEIFDSSALPRQFFNSQFRDISIIPSDRGTQRDLVRVTLSDSNDVVGNSRVNRHRNNDPVTFERTRLQWYDSNTRRSFLPEPTARPKVLGFMNADELKKLPTSIYRIKKTSSTSDDTFTSPDSTTKTLNTPNIVPVLNENQNNMTPSAGTHYLEPESKTTTLVQIQPIQSSPARGHPECEICLFEYQDKDRLRHLPCGHAFHMKCIDSWLKQSTTCPKCRAGVRAGLARLERNRQRQRAQSNSGTTSKPTPIRAVRPRPGASTSNVQEQHRPSNSRQGSQTTSRNQITTQSSVVGTASDTQNNRTTRNRPKPSAAATYATSTTSTNRTTNAPVNQRNQCSILQCSSNQQGRSSEHNNENHDEDDLKHLTISKPSTRENNVSRNKVNESVIARRKAVEAALQRAALSDTIQQQIEGNPLPN
ncbi:unnamed protein product [Schistosoma rodhaini]|uniref:RING-type domain-containing protein n=1 Tax=Schistosoma rodhaini TaxID=6188 RepID=A0A183QE59_9TREM|nr:unnamed protein product [Schistosoma rodhaini]